MYVATCMQPLMQYMWHIDMCISTAMRVCDSLSLTNAMFGCACRFVLTCRADVVGYDTGCSADCARLLCLCSQLCISWTATDHSGQQMEPSRFVRVRPRLLARTRMVSLNLLEINAYADTRKSMQTRTGSSRKYQRNSKRAPRKQQLHALPNPQHFWTCSRQVCTC